MEKIRLKLVAWFLPHGYHICKNPKTGVKRRRKQPVLPFKDAFPSAVKEDIQRLSVAGGL